MGCLPGTGDCSVDDYRAKLVYVLESESILLKSHHRKLTMRLERGILNMGAVVTLLSSRFRGTFVSQPRAAGALAGQRCPSRLQEPGKVVGFLTPRTRMTIVDVIA